MVAYVDTSCLVAIVFGEPGSRKIAQELQGYDELISANLLEAELLSALSREGVDGEPEFLATIGLVCPDRSLGPEIREVLTHGYVRGADLWHLATALYVDESAAELHFRTLDKRQGKLAAAIGFTVP
jgi:predicted nucleic acid-binding protein